MKKFALFAMLICAGFLTFGCSEKKADKKPGDKPPATTPDTGGEKAPETTPPAEPAK
jgi:hypothetical protein